MLKEVVSSTGLTILVDNDEYSMYGLGPTAVTATCQIQGAQAGDVLTLSLVRMDGYGAVLVQSISLTAGQTQAQATFDLTQALDADGLRIARHGIYTVQGSGTGLSGSVQSPPFRVTILTTDELLQSWLFGVNPWNTGQVGVVSQPSVVTGVQVVSVPPSHPKGVFTLVYNPGPPPTLSWNGGPAVSVPPGVSYLNLVEANGSDYIRVKVSSSQLPLAAVQENLILDNQGMTRQAIQNLVDLAQNFVETEVWFFLEPTYVATDPDTLAQGPESAVFTGWADVVGVPQSYYRPHDFMRWMPEKLPHNRLIKVHNLTGWFNDTLTLDITLDWIVWNELNGQVELVPSNGAIVTWQFA